MASDHLVELSDMGKYNVGIAVVARPAGTNLSQYLSHDTITEIYYILKGSGTSEPGSSTSPSPSTITTTGKNAQGQTIRSVSGKVTTTSRTVVAADGKTRTITTTGKDAQGRTINNVAFYDRQ